ncbi:MAG: zinc ribbon domain-containing protein [Chloroflexi bacterium]|nr:zinc ribbon domain-containing protein [Chloroflexota bacterium]
MFDDSESIITFVVAILIAYAVVLWLGSVVWTYRDISSRTHDSWTQSVSVLIVVVFSLPGLFLYLVLRPQETLSDIYERRLEAEALMRDMPQPQPACPNCKQSVNSDYLVCPNCRTRLKEACANCSRPLELGWTACPYCAAPGPSAGAGKATTAEPSQPPQPASQQGPPPPRATSTASQAPAAAKRDSKNQSLWRRISG